MAHDSAKVVWQGRGKHGSGEISTGSGTLRDAPYGFESRFGDAVNGTNPEELVGAAHAACFSMAISFACDAAGFVTESVKTEAQTTLSRDDTGFFISRIALTLRARIPGITPEDFAQLAEKTKQTCPISRALASVPEITLDAQLE
ncbi:MAG: OsmC family protein [Candidatus Dactylopiibacterium sp.]|nr:OsmC family protein [Candidatus Dactylopiibacterium sp.]